MQFYVLGPKFTISAERTPSTTFLKFGLRTCTQAKTENDAVRRISLKYFQESHNFNINILNQFLLTFGASNVKTEGRWNMHFPHQNHMRCSRKKGTSLAKTI